MDEQSKKISLAINIARKKVRALFKRIEVTQLPSLPVSDVGFADMIALGKCGIYFLRSRHDGLLYIGKARDIRQRWRAGGTGDSRYPKHQHHKRCLELGGIDLHWLEIDVGDIDIAEILAIRTYDPPWNVEYSPSGIGAPRNIPDSRCEQDLQEYAAKVPESCFVKLRPTD